MSQQSGSGERSLKERREGFARRERRRERVSGILQNWIQTLSLSFAEVANHKTKATKNNKNENDVNEVIIIWESVMIGNQWCSNKYLSFLKLIIIITENDIIKC